jgi:hypothetical protein
MKLSTITTVPQKILARILVVIASAVLLGSWGYSQGQPPLSGESATIKTNSVTTSVNTKTYAQVPGSVLQLFYRGADNSLYTRWRNPDGSWSGEQHLGGILNGDPFAARVPGTNILQLFYRGADNSVYTRWRNPDGSWSGEQHLGGILNGDPIAAQVPGTNILQLFYRGADNSVYTRWRNPNGSWSGEQHLGGILNGDPIAAQVP